MANLLQFYLKVQSLVNTSLVSNDQRFLDPVPVSKLESVYKVIPLERKGRWVPLKCLRPSPRTLLTPFSPWSPSTLCLKILLIRSCQANSFLILFSYCSLTETEQASLGQGQTRWAPPHWPPVGFSRMGPCTCVCGQTWEMCIPVIGWKKHKLESRLPGEISISSDIQMTPPLWQKVKRN